ncbi:NucA/NucB deoxyribonuclease domain-containing protein [Streptomyces sp. PsTaAH-124]|uniref:NucA/NucB deoxyribonuclease domain-containing protein n=1 Tax=Streptomyces sp. PsTaAH-124 TaxID=1157638 RepID=UPI00039CCA36|nr:hypothetical protein [Streptomyces sp. PsTaAH-124]
MRAVFKATLIALALALLPAQVVAAAPQAQSDSASELSSVGAAKLPEPKPNQAKRPTARGVGAAEDSCARVRARIDVLKAEGAQTVACVTSAPARKPSAPSISPSSFSAEDDREALPLPPWCYESSNGDGTWYYNRFQACSIATNLVNVIDVKSGATVGQIFYQTNEYVYTNDELANWGHQVTIRLVTQWGETAGTTVQGDAICNGTCTLSVGHIDFPSQPLSQSNPPFGEAFPETTATATGAVGEAKSVMYWQFKNPKWAKQPDLVGSQVAVPIRCDNDTKGVSTVGCVFKDYEPVNVVSRNGLYPKYAKHISEAQASGLPGAYPDGQPLTRQTDSAEATKNRSTACPQASKGGYTRPAGYSCDEYPFASTHEGAANNPTLGRSFSWCQISQLSSRTGPGWSACMIPATENTAAGRDDLRPFYNKNRVLEKDKFYVWIVD